MNEVWSELVQEYEAFEQSQAVAAAAAQKQQNMWDRLERDSWNRNYQTVQTEHAHACEKWELLLQQVPKEIRQTVGVVLDSTKRCFNSAPFGYEDSPVLLNRNLALTVLLFRDSAFPRLVPMQPLQGPAGLFFTFDRKDGNVREHSIAAKTFNSSVTGVDEEAFHNFGEKYILTQVATDLGDDLSDFVVGELRSAARTVSEIPFNRHTLRQLSEEMYRATGQAAEWAITSTDIAESVFNLPVKHGRGIYHSGLYPDQQIEVYVDPNLGHREVLLGCKRNWESQYVFLPFVMALTPSSYLNFDSFKPKMGRYTSRFATYKGDQIKDQFIRVLPV